MTNIHQSSATFWFSIFDLVKLFNYDETKIDIYIEHKFVRYDDEGNKTVTDTRYDVRKCDGSDFNET